MITNDELFPGGADYYFLPRVLKKEMPPLRGDFPALRRKVNGRPLVWLDNAATTQKPQSVIDALCDYYSRYNSNVHRGAHTLAREATDAYEGAREKMRLFLGAGSREEIVFVRGTTEAINLVASAWGADNISRGDEILITEMEHHSNIVPWQLLAQRGGAAVKAAPVNGAGEIDLSEYGRMFTPRTRIAAAAHVSNVLGTINPVREMARIAHSNGALFLVDGAQSAPHTRIDVKSLGCDFFALSGHKMYGPTGIGVLYGRKELLDSMRPYQGGGNMIRRVGLFSSEYEESPDRFEAGTGSIADAVALGAAADYLLSAGMETIESHERALTEYLLRGLSGIRGLRVIGAARERTSVVSFVIEGKDPGEIACALDRSGIAVRAGHHCAMPVHARFGVEGTVRASVGLYNTYAELDLFIASVRALSP